MGVRPLYALIGLSCAVGLTGCTSGALGGFTPMYAVPGVERGLSSIEVAAPAGRTSFLVREALEDALATDRAAKPAYRLNFQVEQARVARGLRVDNIANRYEVHTTVSYALLALPNRKLLTKGKILVNVTSDSADQPYAGVAAQMDADKRSAHEAARRISNALAGYFANPVDVPATEATAATAEAVGMRSAGDRLGAQDITRNPAEQSGTATPADEGVVRLPTQP